MCALSKAKGRVVSQLECGRTERKGETARECLRGAQGSMGEICAARVDGRCARGVELQQGWAHRRVLSPFFTICLFFSGAG